MSLHWTRLMDKNRQTDCLKLRKWTQQIKCNQLATPCTILHSCKNHISLLLSGFITQDQYDYAANVTFFGAFSGHLGQEDAVDWQNAAPLGMFEVSSNSGPTSFACILTKTLWMALSMGNWAYSYITPINGNMGPYFQLVGALYKSCIIWTELLGFGTRFWKPSTAPMKRYRPIPAELCEGGQSDGW